MKEYTFFKESQLFEMPEGWIVGFIEDMLDELQAEVNRSNLNDYNVCQAKEKFGSLRWYDYCGNDETDKIVKKYENISEHTCCGCGKPATKISLGWICPWCDECAKKISGDFRDIK